MDEEYDEYAFKVIECDRCGCHHQLDRFGRLPYHYIGNQVCIGSLVTKHEIDRKRKEIEHHGNEANVGAVTPAQAI